MVRADNDDVFGECDNNDSDSNKSVLDSNDNIVEAFADGIICADVEDEDEEEEEEEDEGEEEYVSIFVNLLHYLLVHLRISYASIYFSLR